MPICRPRCLCRHLDACCLSGELAPFFPAVGTRLKGNNASQSGGQNCIGVERFLVHTGLYERFVETMSARVAGLRQGDVLAPGASERQIDVGAMVTDRLFDRLEGLIRDAVRDGARLLVGGERDGSMAGHYFKPTLLVDVCVGLARLALSRG